MSSDLGAVGLTLALAAFVVFLLAFRLRQYRARKKAGLLGRAGGFWSYLNSEAARGVVVHDSQQSRELRSGEHTANVPAVGNSDSAGSRTTLRGRDGPQGPSVQRDRVLFICYRREDTSDAAGRLHDNLANAYGDSRVFMDIDSVPLGTDFVEHVTSEIASCNAVIVVIGRHWLTSVDKQGRRRLDIQEDLVRVEIAAALQRRIPVIPVLVQDAEMPTGEELPEDIRPLARRNGIELSAIRWRTDVERLIKELDRVMKPSAGP